MVVAASFAGICDIAMSQDDDEIISPCIGVCRVNEANLCIGCWRHLDEISEWPEAGDERKRAILAVLESRRERRPDPRRTRRFW